MSLFAKEARVLTRLATPVAATQLSSMLLWTVDLLMVGRLGLVELNAVSLGRLWIVGTAMVGIGLIFGLDPVAAQAHGARDRNRLGETLLHGVVLALLISVPIGFAWLSTERILLAFGQDPATVALAARYVEVQIAALPAYLLFQVFQRYLQARGIVRPAMWISFGANFFNGVVNYLLIFGKLGLPALGAVGAGVATAITELAMLGAILIAMRRLRLQRGSVTLTSPRLVRPARLAEIAQLGAPVALQLGLEYWAFAIASLWAGRLGALELAAHSIALNLASIAYMVPLGISGAAATRVGNRIGAGDREGAHRAAWLSLAMGVGTMSLFALLFILGRRAIPGAYGATFEVVALAATLLPIVAAFEAFDGLQAVAGGVLRGMGETRAAALANLVGFYGLGLPLGWVLGRPDRLGLAGIWWGLALGLFVVALVLVVRIALRGPRQAVAIVDRNVARATAD